MTSKSSSKRPDKIQAEKFIGQVVHRSKGPISNKESILFSLSIGFNQDPMREQDFKYTSEVHEDFGAFPLVGTVVHHTDFMKTVLDSSCFPNFNPNLIRHTQQSFTMVKDKVELDVEYEHECIVTDVIDKGKNAIVWQEVKSYINNNGKKELAFYSNQSLAIIGLGGFGFKGKNNYPNIVIPKRKADMIAKVTTFQNQAFIFRLLNDRNPLHIDPKISSQQKLQRPIIHGMATYGSVARVLVQQILGNDPSRLKTYYTRFIGHVYPGQVLIISIWKQDEAFYAYEAQTQMRKTKVLIGNFELKPAPKL